MFSKILIANRGEIACRVIETARRMGIRTVAVYSEADAHARHVSMADEAVALGGATPAESYLRGDAMVAAALSTGVEAIHPGYGFLSENPAFVEAVEKAGLVFIGPSAAAICAMGLKDAAKALMEKAGVPVVPGYHGATQDADVLGQEAERIGYPVLIKAVAGGGGKGMRLVQRPADFQDALMSAQREALAAFGNSDVLIEKYITQPRHIEVQIFGDGEQAVHLFERDCSLQRRHQKVIEEAPAPGMSAEMRTMMGAAAVRAAEAIGYRGAGTVEFIVDASEGLRPDRFWFMEMNTRLQVEHPVTEMITGHDLVAWQIRVAAGEALPATQAELHIQGHAFEARLFAEDVTAGFLPATGTLTHLSFPKAVRADRAVRAGDEISPYYDPMIAKVIVHGADRVEALQKLRRALEETEVAGSVTNLEFLRALSKHKGFSKGQVDTGLIARDLDALIEVPEITARSFAEAALASIQGALTKESGFTLWGALQQCVVLGHEGAQTEVLFTVLTDARVKLSVGQTVFQAEKRDDRWWIDERRVSNTHITGDQITVFSVPTRVFELIDPLAQQGELTEASGDITAPMPGLVKAVFVRAGQDVQKGARLAILEAMKMEHALLAAMDGQVKEVLVTEGDQVSAQDVLIQMEAEGA